MAMTKAEKAQLEEMQTALSMHWPSYPSPAPMTREEIKEGLVDIPRRDRSIPAYGDSRKAAIGWFYNAHSETVTRGWGDGFYINRDSHYGDAPSRSDGNPMFKTRKEAAMALRLDMTRKFARKLAAIDRVITDDEA